MDVSTERFCTKTYMHSSDDTEESLALVREKGFITLNQHCDTVLHFLAIKGNVAAFKTLAEEGLLAREALRNKNVHGCTALHEAVRYGHKEVAEIMLMQESDLAFVEDKDGETPLYVAAKYGKDEVFRLLEYFGSDCFAKRNDGRTILHAAIDSEHYSLATTILSCYPALAKEHDQNGMTALNLLATNRSSFKSGSELGNVIGRSPFKLSEPYSIGAIFLPLQFVEAIFYHGIPEMYVESEIVVNQEDQHAIRAGVTKRPRPLWLKAILGLPWLRKIDREKQKHGLALLLARRLISLEDWGCYMTLDSNSSSPTSPMMINPLIQATKLGNKELISAIIKACPQVSDSLDENGRNILHIAVERKNLDLYIYLKKRLAYKDRMLAEVDKYGNTILHLASYMGVIPFPNYFSRQGVSLELSTTDTARQMCWDVYWFKHTKLDCSPHLRHIRNNDGKTADELFEENHLRIRKVAQRESIESINGIIVVATLFCTVNYAALFTVPGGFDDQTGLPVLDKDYLCFKFLVSVYAAIFCSFISIAILLSLQRSGFYAEEFYIGLPLKAVGASICLLLSAVFTITASAQAIVLESKRVNSFVLLDFILPMGYIIMIPMFIDMSYRIFAYLYYAFMDFFFSI